MSELLHDQDALETVFRHKVAMLQHQLLSTLDVIEEVAKTRPETLSPLFMGELFKKFRALSSLTNLEKVS